MKNFGFCFNNAENSENYYRDTPSSFMIFLNNNDSKSYFYSRSQKSDYLNNPPYLSTYQIYTTILDIKKKKMEFLLNGKSLGPLKTISFKEEDMEFLCPCVDLGYDGDKVTLV